MRWAFFAVTAAWAIGCGTSDDAATSPPDASPVDATTSDASPGGDDAGSDGGGLAIGITGATLYAGAVATVTATTRGAPPAGPQAGPIWSVVSAPPGSLVANASLAIASDALSVTFTTDVVGDYVLRFSEAGASADATVHALAAPVFFARTTLNSTGGILDVHVAGHDGSQSHGVACTTTFDNQFLDDGRLRTMLTGAGGMDAWEAPAGQPSRFVFAGVASLRPDADGGYAVSLIAGTDQSSCTSAPTTLRSLQGPVGALGQPRISPDGRRVAFLEPLASTFQVSTVALDGTGWHVVAPIYNGIGPPDGSPDEASNIRVEWKDATTLVWPRPNGDGTWTVMVTPDAPSTPETPVTCAGSTPHHLAVLPGGAIVAAFSPAAGAPVDLFAIDPSSASCAIKKNLTGLAGARSRAHDFAVSPDGAWVAFLRWDASNDGGPDPNNEGDLYMVPSDGSAAASPVGAPTAGRIGPRFIGGGSRLAWTRVSPPLAGPDGGDPRYAEAVSVLLRDGGSPYDIAVGNGADTIVAGVGPGGSCAVSGAPSSSGSSAPAVVGGIAIALATLVTRRRRSRSGACARPGAPPSTRAVRPTRATDSGAPPRS